MWNHRARPNINQMYSKIDIGSIPCLVFQLHAFNEKRGKHNERKT